jgi:nucleotide-binding universal stress UspA family protein
MSEKSSIVVPVDGSANVERAVRFAIELVAKGFAETLHLVNVQPSVGGVVSTFVDRATITDYHREQGEAALLSARKLCDAAGIDFHTHIFVGRPAETICEYTRKVGAKQIVMGSRGHSGMSGVVMGSVAQDVLALASVPITLVK